MRIAVRTKVGTTESAFVLLHSKIDFNLSENKLEIRMLAPPTAEQIALVHKRIREALRSSDDEMMAAASISDKIALARSRHTATPGLVYFIQCGDFVKIGYTGRDDVVARANELCANNPYKLLILCTIPGSISLEREMHRAFRDHHHKGEWFRLTEDLQPT